MGIERRQRGNYFLVVGFAVACRLRRYRRRCVSEEIFRQTLAGGGYVVDSGKQEFGAEGLGEIRVGSRFVAFFLVGQRVFGSEEYYRDVTGHLVVLELPGHVHAREE